MRSLREEFDFPIFLNADHTHSLSDAVEAAKAGFEAIVFDASALLFEQNVRKTKEAVEALKTVNPAILVEGELGDIGTGSEIHEQAPDLSKGLTSPAQAKDFVERRSMFTNAFLLFGRITPIPCSLRIPSGRGNRDGMPTNRQSGFVNTAPLIAGGRRIEVYLREFGEVARRFP